MGFIVDAIDWNDLKFKPARQYAGVFDIHMNLGRLSSGDQVKMLHLTGSNPAFSNASSKRRFDDLFERRGVRLLPRRTIPEWQVQMIEANLLIADSLSLVGNEVTRATYPANVRNRISLVPVTGSYLENRRKPIDVKFRKEFLWFGGSGAVHKGLDLTLEVFAKLKHIVLHVIGPHERESDFAAAYDRELHQLPNIRSHGYLDPSSVEFWELTRHVIGHVFPSCSESTSTAAVTCMQYGFVPIVGVNCGIDVTRDMGRVLRDCSLVEIEEAIREIEALDTDTLKGMIKRSQDYALKTFSKERFTETMTRHLSLAMGSIVN